MMKIELRLPRNRYSPVEFFLEEFKDPECISRLTILKSTLLKSEEDPRIRKNQNVFIIEGKNFPIKYKVEKTRKGYKIVWIKIPNKRYTFPGRKINENIEVVLTC